MHFLPKNYMRSKIIGTFMSDTCLFVDDDRFTSHNHSLCTPHKHLLKSTKSTNISFTKYTSKTSNMHTKKYECNMTQMNAWMQCVHKIDH